MITAQSRFNPVAKTMGKRVQFTVNLANRAHIMGILSGLYADPIRAVIRELSVNANESHKAKGNKAPIKVTLPSQSGPTFIIKDEGLGLNIDEFGSLMASYGSSGEYKSTSNEYTGGFGLGCKAPAAYTDQWSVVCTKDGKRWSLVCFKDEFGVPSSDTLDESETDEPNGVEVRLPVKAGDVDRFRSTAIEVFKVFRAKPTVTNATSEEDAKLNELPRDTIVEEDNWRIANPDNSSDSFVVMGDVKYPINYSNFKLPDDLSVATVLPITFQIEVGGLQVAPSREALMYTPMTVKRLTAEIDKVVDNLEAVIEKRIKTAPTWWDACVAANVFTLRGYSSDQRLDKLLKRIKSKVLWNGQKVDGMVSLPTVKVDGNLESHPDLTMTLCSYRNWGANRLRQEKVNSLNATRNVSVFLVPDKKSFRTGRIKLAYENKILEERGTVYVITTKKDWPTLCVEHPELAKIKYECYTTLPEPPTDSSGTTQSYDKNAKHTKGKVFELDLDMVRRNSRKESDHWKLTNAEYTEDDWWVEIEKFNPTGEITSNDTLKRAIVRLTDAKLFTGRILAKKKGDPIPDDAIRFQDGLKDAVTRMFKGNQALGELVWRRVEHDLADHEDRNIFHGYAKMEADEWKGGHELPKAIRASKLPDQHPAKKLVELLDFKFTAQVMALANLIVTPTSYGLKEIVDPKIIEAFKPDDELTLKHHSDVLLRGWPMLRWASLDGPHYYGSDSWMKKYKASPTKDLISYMGIIQKP